MIDSTRFEEQGWSWGAESQLWACRLSHVLGLVAVLALLWFVAAG
jgi:hypothetical protein